MHGAESRYIKHAEASTDDVETLYNREWARTVLEGSLEALSQDYAERGQKARFDLLATHLTQEDPEISMAQSALSAGMTAEAYRTALHRLRQRLTCAGRARRLAVGLFCRRRHDHIADAEPCFRLA